MQRECNLKKTRSTKLTVPTRVELPSHFFDGVAARGGPRSCIAVCTAARCLANPCSLLSTSERIGAGARRQTRETVAICISFRAGIRQLLRKRRPLAKNIPLPIDHVHGRHQWKGDESQNDGRPKQMQPASNICKRQTGQFLIS